MALVRNLVYGDVDSVQLALVQDSVLLHAVEKQLHVSTQPEICIQVHAFFYRIVYFYIAPFWRREAFSYTYFSWISCVVVFQVQYLPTIYNGRTEK